MLSLKELAATPCTKTMVLRGHTVEVRPIPQVVTRRIEEQLPYPSVTGDDPKAVAAHKSTPAYQSKCKAVEHARQRLRVAYAAQITNSQDEQWTPDRDREWASAFAVEIGNLLTDGEVGEIYNASYEALKTTLDPKNQIGGDTQGN